MKTLINKVLLLPRNIKKSIAIIVDAIVCGFTIWISFVIRLGDWFILFDKHITFLFFSVLASIILLLITGFYQTIFRYVSSDHFFRTLRFFLPYYAIFFISVTLIGIPDVPRSIGFIQPILFFIGIWFVRYFVFVIFDIKDSNYHVSIKLGTRSLIYGAGDAGRQLLNGLSSNPNMRILGFIDDDDSLHGNTINGLKVYKSSDILNTISMLKISDVLLALPSVSNSRRQKIISILSGCGVRVRSIPSLSDIFFNYVPLTNLSDLDIDDLLGRKTLSSDQKILGKQILNKVVLVTGAGGSIGFELCKEIYFQSPSLLILIDSSEFNLYTVYEELKKIGNQNNLHNKQKEISIIPYLCTVCDKIFIDKIFFIHRPDTVFHVAAYKHVPLVECNEVMGLRNNVWGTLNCVEASLKHAVSSFTLISTDKAVRPTNIMGVSKRLAEMIVQANASYQKNNHYSTIFSIVRFGNVFGSSGSVAPLFLSQIKEGGPVSITHPEVTRYFMTTVEAAELVIQSSSMATSGDLFILDMGEPIKIYDLAIRMIHMSGLTVKNELNPNGDIQIKFIGLRPGEKLHEELLIGGNLELTQHPKIMKAKEEFLEWEVLEKNLSILDYTLQEGNGEKIRILLNTLVPEYQPNNNLQNF